MTMAMSSRRTRKQKRAALILAGVALLGIAAGLVLYHAAFGFTSAWRVFISDRRGAGLRAQMLMLAVTCLAFFPILASGSFFGQAVRGSVAAPGLSVALGAFIFGIGMQLGGGCASGTLYSAGGGSTRMYIVLAAFIAGSLAGTAHAPWWGSLPAWSPTSIVQLWGPAIALAVSLATLTLLAYVCTSLALMGWLLPVDWWRPLAVLGSLGSLGLLLIGFHPWLLAGVAIDIAIVAAIWLDWQPLRTVLGA